MSGGVSIAKGNIPFWKPGFGVFSVLYKLYYKLGMDLYIHYKKVLKGTTLNSSSKTSWQKEYTT